jgi:hypothetical protein
MTEDSKPRWWHPFYRRRWYKANQRYLAAFKIWQAQAHEESQSNEKKGVLLEALVTPEGVQYVRWLVTPPPRQEDFWS